MHTNRLTLSCSPKYTSTPNRLQVSTSIAGKGPHIVSLFFLNRLDEPLLEEHKCVIRQISRFAAFHRIQLVTSKSACTQYVAGDAHRIALRFILARTPFSTRASELKAFSAENVHIDPCVSLFKGQEEEKESLSQPSLAQKKKITAIGCDVKRRIHRRRLYLKKWTADKKKHGNNGKANRKKIVKKESRNIWLSIQ